MALTEQQIQTAAKAFERALRQCEDFKFATIVTTIEKGAVKHVTLHPEIRTLHNGELVRESPT